MKSRNYIWAVIGGASLVLAFLLPLIANPTWMRLLTDFFKVAAMASAWNLIGGFTGYPSFGQVFFFGLGAYATGLAMTDFGWPFAAALLLSAIVCLAFGLLLGLPVLRLKGHYFAIATLGAAEAMREIVRNVEILEANRGIVMPLVHDPQLFYFLTLGLLLMAIGLTWLITKSRFGYGLIAIREDEEAAEVLGINTRLFKTAAFCLSGVIVGLVGGIHAYHFGFIDPTESFDVLRTVSMIVMAVIGGAGTVFGPLIGSALIFFSSEYLAGLSEQLRTLPVIFFGGLLIFAALFLPKGLWEILSGRQKLSWRSFLENIRAHRV